MKALAALAAGLVAGVAAEQMAVRQPWRPDPYKDENFGGVRGEPHWLRASDGVELYVEVQKALDPAAPTIVMAHGYCLNQDSWHFQRKALNGEANLVLWDHRSHGRSQRSEIGNCTIDQLGTDLQWVIDGFTEGPVTLVGHSMGGMTIMAFADQFPDTVADRVNGVALLATSCGGLSDSFIGLPAGIARRGQKAVTNFKPGKMPMGRVVQRARYTDLNFAATKRASFGHGAPNSLNTFTVEMLNATSMDTVVEFLPTLLALDKADALKVLSEIPTLVACGESDVMTPVSHTRTLIEGLPETEGHILPDTGHMIQLERNEFITERIRHLAFSDRFA